MRAAEFRVASASLEAFSGGAENAEMRWQVTARGRLGIGDRLRARDQVLVTNLTMPRCCWSMRR
jgi:hypothetical protein